MFVICLGKNIFFFHQTKKKKMRKNCLKVTFDGKGKYLKRSVFMWYRIDL